MSTIENLSLFFDSAWYLAFYTDVAAVNADPMEHYLLFGYKEGRNPNRFFNTDFYLRTNPDVANSAINPFIHYILHGATEGRLPRPFGQEPSPRISLPTILPTPAATIDIGAFSPQEEHIKPKLEVVPEPTQAAEPQVTSAPMPPPISMATQVRPKKPVAVKRKIRTKATPKTKKIAS